MFAGEDLERFIAQATWVTVNDYEWQLVQQKTGWSAARGDRAGRGAHRHARRRGLDHLHARAARSRRSPAPPVNAVVDPTGCGDAYRAGLIHGLLHGLDWQTTGHIASLMGAIKIEARGTQNHRFTQREFAARGWPHLQ